jgi:hypothetical protein
LVRRFEADFLTAPGAMAVVGVDGAEGVDVAADFFGFSLPFSLLASSSLEAALEGTLARLKWSSSGGSKLVPAHTQKNSKRGRV